MKMKILIGITFISLIIILSSYPSILADNNLKPQEFKNIKEFFSNKINGISNLFWYPGFFLTLLLAPFIIIYLIIAIILDIGNP